jgi:hypothetical protein
MTFGRPKPWTPRPDLVPKASTRRQDAKGPVRNRIHLGRIKEMPCLVCKPGEQRTRTDPHHAKAALPAMQGLKESDLICLPLCRDHHTQGEDRLHRIGAPESAFWAKHGINPAKALIDLLRRMYPRQTDEVQDVIRRLSVRAAA